MAYKKSYGKKRYRKRRYYRKREPDVVDVARYAAKGVSKIFRMINVEYKIHDKTETSINIGTTPTLIKLDTIAVGDGYNNRDGISIKPITLTVRYLPQVNASALRNVMRIIIFRGKNENGVAFTAADLLENASGTQACISPKSYENRFKTKVLYDKTFNLNHNGANSRRFVEKHIKLFGHVNFNIADTTGATVENGGLYALYVSSDNINQPVLDSSYRLTYTDN